MTRHVSDDEIFEVLGGSQDAEEAAQALLERALSGGGSDNITVIIGRFEAATAHESDLGAPDSDKPSATPVHDSRDHADGAEARTARMESRL